MKTEPFPALLGGLVLGAVGGVALRTAASTRKSEKAATVDFGFKVRPEVFSALFRFQLRLDVNSSLN
jgi:hypothetical protein